MVEANADFEKLGKEFVSSIEPKDALDKALSKSVKVEAVSKEKISGYYILGVVAYQLEQLRMNPEFYKNNETQERIVELEENLKEYLSKNAEKMDINESYLNGILTTTMFYAYNALGENKVAYDYSELDYSVEKTVSSFFGSGKYNNIKEALRKDPGFGLEFKQKEGKQAVEFKNKSKSKELETYFLYNSLVNSSIGNPIDRKELLELGFSFYLVSYSLSKCGEMAEQAKYEAIHSASMNRLIKVGTPAVGLSIFNKLYADIMLEQDIDKRAQRLKNWTSLANEFYVQLSLIENQEEKLNYLSSLDSGVKNLVLSTTTNEFLVSSTINELGSYIKKLDEINQKLKDKTGIDSIIQKLAEGDLIAWETVKVNIKNGKIAGEIKSKGYNDRESLILFTSTINLIPQIMHNYPEYKDAFEVYNMFIKSIPNREEISEQFKGREKDVMFVGESSNFIARVAFEEAFYTSDLVKLNRFKIELPEEQSKVLDINRSRLVSNYTKRIENFKNIEQKGFLKNALVFDIENNMQSPDYGTGYVKVDFNKLKETEIYKKLSDAGYKENQIVNFSANLGIALGYVEQDEVEQKALEIVERIAANPNNFQALPNSNQIYQFFESGKLRGTKLVEVKRYEISGLQFKRYDAYGNEIKQAKWDVNLDNAGFFVPVLSDLGNQAWRRYMLDNIKSIDGSGTWFQQFYDGKRKLGLEYQGLAGGFLASIYSGTSGGHVKQIKEVHKKIYDFMSNKSNEPALKDLIGKNPFMKMAFENAEKFYQQAVESKYIINRREQVINDFAASYLAILYYEYQMGANFGIEKYENKPEFAKEYFSKLGEIAKGSDELNGKTDIKIKTKNFADFCSLLAGERQIKLRGTLGNAKEGQEYDIRGQQIIDKNSSINIYLAKTEITKEPYELIKSFKNLEDLKKFGLGAIDFGKKATGNEAIVVEFTSKDGKQKLYYHADALRYLTHTSSQDKVITSYWESNAEGENGKIFGDLYGFTEEAGLNVHPNYGKFEGTLNLTVPSAVKQEVPYLTQKLFNIDDVSPNVILPGQIGYRYLPVFSETMRSSVYELPPSVPSWQRLGIAPNFTSDFAEAFFPEDVVKSIIYDENGNRRDDREASREFLRQIFDQNGYWSTRGDGSLTSIDNLRNSVKANGSGNYAISFNDINNVRIANFNFNQTLNNGDYYINVNKRADGSYTVRVYLRVSGGSDQFLGEAEFSKDGKIKYDYLRQIYPVAIKLNDAVYVDNIKGGIILSGSLEGTVYTERGISGFKEKTFGRNLFGKDNDSKNWVIATTWQLARPIQLHSNEKNPFFKTITPYVGMRIPIKAWGEAKDMKINKLGSAKNFLTGINLSVYDTNLLEHKGEVWGFASNLSISTDPTKNLRGLYTSVDNVLRYRKVMVEASLGFGANFKTGKLGIIPNFGIGFDKNKDNKMDYGLRVFSVFGPIAIPELVINGKGLISDTLSYPFKWVFKKIGILEEEKERVQKDVAKDQEKTKQEKIAR